MKMLFWERGVCRFRIADYSGAKEDFSDVIKINPKNYNCLYNRGLTNERLGNRKEAIGDLKKLLK
ncbi:MAG: tetratricopeptide repeat protein [Saprospiraceae bacterium]|nr:tetratricopeptide repeat protein [Saprospiraceae bacterium]